MTDSAENRLREILSSLLKEVTRRIGESSECSDHLAEFTATFRLASTIRPGRLDVTWILRSDGVPLASGTLECM
jgi:hypothetical protein